MEKHSCYKLITINKKATFNYFFIEKYTAGIVLLGTEIKSIRQSKVNIQDAFCFFHKGELFVKQMHISLYKFGNIYNHDEYRVRKLLLTKRELNKLFGKLDIGITIVPTKLFIDEHNRAKLEIALAKGKKIYDKRRTIKERDIKRQMNQELKYS